jgi:hypothetical protein
MDIRKTVAFSFNRYSLSQRLRLEVTGCKRQAHHSHGSKNNENDVFHGVTSFSDMTLESILLSFSALLTAHPLPYVWPAIEELDTAFFTGVQKSNYLDIHERHSVEVQRNPRPSSFHLPLQFLQMPRLQPTAQTNHRLETAGFFFKLYCHL